MRKKNKLYSVKELMLGVYGFTNCGVASFLILGETHALVFDTGYGVIDLCKAVREITDLPLYVVISHGHYDHSCGCSHFEGPYYMHKADLDVYHLHNSPKVRKLGLDGIELLQKVLFILKIIRGFDWIPKDLDKNVYYNAMPEDNFTFIEEGHIFDLGGVTAQVYEIPGHTPGSIGLLVKEKEIFFASDGINGNPFLFLPESQKLSVYIESVKKAMALDFKLLATGHSTTLEPKSNLEKYLSVAQNPDVKNAKKHKGIPELAPDAETIIVSDKTNRGKKGKEKNRATLTIDRKKIDISFD